MPGWINYIVVIPHCPATGKVLSWAVGPALPLHGRCSDAPRGCQDQAPCSHRARTKLVLCLHQAHTTLTPRSRRARAAGEQTLLLRAGERKHSNPSTSSAHAKAPQGHHMPSHSEPHGRTRDAAHGAEDGPPCVGDGPHQDRLEETALTPQSSGRAAASPAAAVTHRRHSRVTGDAREACAKTWHAPVPWQLPHAQGPRRGVAHRRCGR